MDSFAPKGPPEGRLAHLAASATRAETPLGAGRMAWHEWGAGPPLVLLHGGAGSWRHWARNIEPLAARHRVLAPDLPGLGNSDLPPAGTDLWGLAALVAAGIAARLGPGTPYRLTGFSFGAIIAGHVAARFGEAMTDLTLLGAGGLGLPRQPTPLLSVRERTGEDRMAAHRENLARLMIANPARIDAEALAIQAWNSDHARFPSRRVTTSTSLRDALEEVRAPLSVIYGERDAITLPDLASRIALFQARGARTRVVPGAGHWVAFEAPDSVNAALLEEAPAPAHAERPAP